MNALETYKECKEEINEIFINSGNKLDDKDKLRKPIAGLAAAILESKSLLKNGKGLSSTSQEKPEIIELLNSLEETSNFGKALEEQYCKEKFNGRCKAEIFFSSDILDRSQRLIDALKKDVISANDATLNWEKLDSYFEENSKKQPDYKNTKYNDDSDISDEEFPYKIEKDGENNKGGKSTKNQGRLFFDKDCVYEEYYPQKNETLTEQVKWTYVVVVQRSVKDERTSQSIIDDYYKLLLPEKEAAERLGILIGSNEQATVDDSKVKDKKNEIYNNYNIPIVQLYTKFQANWVRRSDLQEVEITEVQKEYKEAKTINQKRANHLLRYEKKRTHFPFGAHRTNLYNQSYSQKLFKYMSERTSYSGKSVVFLHNQDSDYISFDDKAFFYNGAFVSNTWNIDAMLQNTSSTKTQVPMIAKVKKELVEVNNEPYLLKKYDKKIEDFYKENRIYPYFIGGAHNYAPDEDVSYLKTRAKWEKINLENSKMWTRFGSEMGNAIRHLISKYNPYGLYFHEPNTMMLWRPSEKIQFGKDSEVLEYFRKSFSNSERNNPKKYAKFDATVTLTTSQKRGSKKPFTVQFAGIFENKKFKNWTYKDIQHLQSMSQEYLTSNDWASIIATAYKDHKKKKGITGNNKKSKEKNASDARAILAYLYNFYDPHFLAYQKKTHQSI